MPDALPPVGVLLSALDAAALPLAGTEETFVMQGGQPKRTPVSSIGGGASETYAPTLVASSGTAVTRGFSGAGPLGLSRVGSGAGSTATLFGAITFTGAIDGATIDLPLPPAAPAAPSPYPLVEVIRMFDDTVAVVTGAPTSLTNIRFTFVSDGADDGAFTFRITYQTSG